MNWKMKLFQIEISSLCFATLLGCQTPTEKASRVDALPYYNDPTFTPNWFPDGPPEGFHQIPPFQLANQDGEEVNEYTFRDKIYVTDFFFTSCPGICPKMTRNMHLLQEAFMEDDQVLLLSHSVTPDYDSVPALKAYAEKEGVQSGKWHLVTGERDLIYDLGRNYYFVEEDLGVAKTVDDFLHTENFVLVDHNKYIRGIYNGLNKASVQQLIADIKLLEGV